MKFIHISVCNNIFKRLLPNEETQVINDAPNEEPQQEPEAPANLEGELENFLKMKRDR